MGEDTVKKVDLGPIPLPDINKPPTCEEMLQQVGRQLPLSHTLLCRKVLVCELCCSASLEGCWVHTACIADASKEFRKRLSLLAGFKRAALLLAVPILCSNIGLNARWAEDASGKVGSSCTGP